MYTFTYTWTSFDPLTAKLTVSVQVLYDGNPVETKTIRITLPVDPATGAATTNTGIIDYLVNERVLRYLPDVVNNTRIPAGGVTNASTILAQTDTIEAGEGIPVLVIPWGGSSTNFTSSIIVAASNDTVGSATAPVIDIVRADLPTTGEIVPGNTILDNGNVNGATIRSIRGVNDTTSPYVSVVITVDPTVVPSEVVTAYPYVFRDVIPGYGDPGFNFNEYLTYYYATHSPISIVGSYAIGVFNY